eukprot:1160233-Pelagomonas_calceolata.AAC.1
MDSVKDGAPPLKLALNRDDNPYLVADAFMAEHDLPTTYKDQVWLYAVCLARRGVPGVMQGVVARRGTRCGCVRRAWQGAVCNLLFTPARSRLWILLDFIEEQPPNISDKTEPPVENKSF